MRRFLWAMMLLVAGVSEAPKRVGSREQPSEGDVAPHRPLSVPCPRCNAERGQPCNARTLGAHRYHMDRVTALVEALEAAL